MATFNNDIINYLDMIQEKQEAVFNRKLTEIQEKQEAVFNRKLTEIQEKMEHIIITQQQEINRLTNIQNHLNEMIKKILKII
jgi:hypothetical protein